MSTVLSAFDKATSESGQWARIHVAATYNAPMAEINIENFYRHIARILNILYIAFPNKTPVYVDDVAGIDDPDEYGLHSPTYTSGFFALIWLADEGYLRYVSTIRQDGIDQACLTHKAFMILTEATDPIYTEGAPDPSNVVSISGRESQLPPSVAEEQRLVINQLRNALKSGSSIAVTRVVRHILQN
ncbi:MAG: hypothetical protein AAF525_04525 [Pseudomonadota bacterium]